MTCLKTKLQTNERRERSHSSRQILFHQVRGERMTWMVETVYLWRVDGYLLCIPLNPRRASGGLPGSYLAESTSCCAGALLLNFQKCHCFNILPLANNEIVVDERKCFEWWIFYLTYRIVKTVPQINWKLVVCSMTLSVDISTGHAFQLMLINSDMNYIGKVCPKTSGSCSSGVRLKIR